MLKHSAQNKYLINVAIKTAGSFTLNLVQEDGTVAESIWQEEQKAPGFFSVDFGENIPVGKYALQLISSAGEKNLAVSLH